MNAPSFSTALGYIAPLGPQSPESKQQAGGLSRRDPRFRFAAASVRSMRPINQARVAARYAHDPVAVLLPAPVTPLDLNEFPPEIHGFVELVSSARARMNATDRQGGGWALTTGALIRWIEGMEFVPVEALGLLTLALQDDSETLIRRLDQAAWLAISLHAEWRQAAREFLAPYHDTWLAEWLLYRPAYRAIAAVARAEFPDVPAILCEPTN